MHNIKKKLSKEVMNAKMIIKDLHNNESGTDTSKKKKTWEKFKGKDKLN